MPVKSTSRCAIDRFSNYSLDYSLHCTPQGPVTITNWIPVSPITIINPPLDFLATSKMYLLYKKYIPRDFREI